MVDFMSATLPRSKHPASELSAALTSCRIAFLGIGLLSGMSNILMLTGSFYMLEVYDRVLPSRSTPTLVGLTILAIMLFTFQGAIDLIRGRLLVRVGSALDEQLSGRVYEIIVHLPSKVGHRKDGLQSLRDLDSVRSFLSSLGPTAFFDLPWLPLYIGICFLFHFWIGVTALVGAIILVGLTLLGEVLTREPTQTATNFAILRTNLAEASQRNCEVLTAMGMISRLQHVWGTANWQYMYSQRRASDIAGGLGSMVRSLRMMLQSGVLGVGAYLVIQQEATAGIIIAGSILTARALAPVDLAIANWRGFVAARQGWERLGKLLLLVPAKDEPMPLPRPSNSVVVENASAAPPGQPKVVVQDATFALKSGNGLAVIGPSASGKSSLARLLVGVWQPVRGRICLDGASLDHWSYDALGRHIGYLPQDVELISGTIAQNISRFEQNADSSAIIAAAQAAGVHELVLSLPNGYQTEIGERGAALSAGQQQRIALARALYGDPFLVVLDEPNSNLDSEGEAALARAILGIRARGGIVVIVAHRPNTLASVDHVLVMHQGRIQAFGPKDEVLKKVLQRGPAAPLNVVAEGRGAS
jgi:ATP-binding cassette subfamily C protein